ncbi:MAG: hypothetical protein ACLUGG_06555 [Oscillospiraceae bacterium]
MKKTQTQWSNEYNAKAYDRLAVQVKKGRREEIRSHAQARGESLNGFINRAIDETMKRDTEENNPQN